MYYRYRTKYEYTDLITSLTYYLYQQIIYILAK